MVKEKQTTKGDNMTRLQTLKLDLEIWLEELRITDKNDIIRMRFVTDSIEILKEEIEISK